MEFYTFGKESGKQIAKFESDFIMSRILLTDKEINIGCMHLDENGIVGYHQAVVPQLLLVVSGQADVRNEKDTYFTIKPGDAVFWEKDEWHETKSETGLTAIVIQGNELNPALYMPIKEIDVTKRLE